MNLQPTYTGYVSNTQDALILFQATISGRLPAVSRRPHDRERSELVRSGAVFVFNEQTSGIKRWTDGIAWSPSRILGNFLVYRQLEKPFTPGEKKQTNKRSRRNKRPGSSPYSSGGAGRLSPGTDEDVKYPPPAGATGSVTGSSLPIQIDLPNQVSSLDDAPVERSLVGSLVDSYGFKKDGLIKKTMSIIVSGQPHHLVSYYKPEDVLSGVFDTPSNSSFLKDLPISEELTQRQNFRVPLDSADTPRPIQPLPQHQQPLQYVQHAQQHQQPQQPQPPGPYDVPYEVEIQNFDGTRVKTTASPNGAPAAAYYRSGQPLGATPAVPYVGYRPYSQQQQPQQQPQPQQQFLQPEYYPNMASPHQYTRLPAASATTATTTGPAPMTINAAAAAAYSPSLPPLTQQQGYSYQAYPHEHHLDASGADPRRLPDTNAAPAQQQGYSPRPVFLQQQQQHQQQQQQQQHQQQQQPDIQGQHVQPNYAYNYAYNQGQQW